MIVPISFGGGSYPGGGGNVPIFADNVFCASSWLAYLHVSVLVLAVCLHTEVVRLVAYYLPIDDALVLFTSLIQLKKSKGLFIKTIVKQY